ncbi:hypothetical protein [Comamonas thiooxydans]|uniref:hypothetical protein n=1 Tax=Comamonas thiooxydans TaxID=363952 RepID=UPI000B4190A4|nr:hypothetical protein [Comamonas thiooxydans]
MGWKKFKDAYGIYHTVHIEGEQVYISSDFVLGLVRVSRKTGEVVEHGVRGILSALYPALQAAPRSEILRILAEPDEFEQGLPVYLIRDDQVVEHQCEAVGAMQVAHDGTVIRGHFSDTHGGAVKQLIEKLSLRKAQDAEAVIAAQQALDRAIQRHIESSSALSDALISHPEFQHAQ